MEKEYRVVTNGSYFCVQERHRFLCFKWWRFLNPSYISTYQRDAEGYIRELIKKDKASESFIYYFGEKRKRDIKGPWKRPIKEFWARRREEMEKDIRREKATRTWNEYRDREKKEE